MLDLRDACETYGNSVCGIVPDLLSGEDAALAVEWMARAEKRSAGMRILLAARAVECDAPRGWGYSNPATWLAETTGSSGGEARAAFDTAAALGNCPETKEALLAGELSLAQAREITRTEKASPGSEGEMLNLAASDSVNGLRDECRRRRMAAEDPDESHRRRCEERHERHWQDDSGMSRMTAAWPPEVGVPITNRIDAEVDDMIRQAKKDGVVLEPIERIRADALARLIQDPGSGRRLGRPELVLICDIAAFQRGYADPGELCQVIGGAPVPVSVAQEIATAAFIKGVLHNGETIANVAHFHSRYRSAKLQTALGLGVPPLFMGVACVDCGRRYGIEWDHIDPVAHNGPTSYDNIVPRCYPCHKDKTERDRAAGLLTPRRPGTLSTKATSRRSDTDPPRVPPSAAAGRTGTGPPAASPTGNTSPLGEPPLAVTRQSGATPPATSPTSPDDEPSSTVGAIRDPAPSDFHSRQNQPSGRAPISGRGAAPDRRPPRATSRTSSKQPSRRNRPRLLQ